MKSVVLALCSVLLAPYQCATAEYQPLEDTAPKSLWILAERFEKEGQTSAREITLKQLVEQYPGSRYARRARVQLGMADPLDETVTEANLAEAVEAQEGIEAREAAREKNQEQTAAAAAPTSADAASPDAAQE